MSKMANFRFLWYTHTDSFSLDIYYRFYNTCKEQLKGDFRLKDGFQGIF